MAAALDLPLDTPLVTIAKEMEDQNNKDPKFRTVLDRAYKSALDSFTNRINKYVILQYCIFRSMPDFNFLFPQNMFAGRSVVQIPGKQFAVDGHVRCERFNCQYDANLLFAGPNRIGR